MSSSCTSSWAAALKAPPTSTPAGNPQRTFYYSGIGTRLNSRLASLLNMMVAPRFGDARRILKAA